MKKFYSFLIAAVALVGFAACESNEEATPEAEMMTFVASFADETRTALANANGNVKWCANDVIAISNGTQTANFTITSINGDGSAVFTGERMDGETFYAIYPAEGATFNSGSWTYTVPATQTAKNGTFADGAAVSTAVCTDGETLFFENQCAVLRFEVPEFTETISSVEFFNGSTPVVKVTGTMAKDNVYYATVKPGDYKFTVRINGYLSKESTKTLSVAANTIYGLGVLPAPEKCAYGLCGAHQGWNTENTTALYKVDEKKSDSNILYACFNVKLQDNGFKFVTGNSWTNAFGAYGHNYTHTFELNTWYQAASDKLGDFEGNFGVSNYNKSYDIYLQVDTESWGKYYRCNIVEHGTTITF